MALALRPNPARAWASDVDVAPLATWRDEYNPDRPETSGIGGDARFR